MEATDAAALAVAPNLGADSSIPPMYNPSIELPHQPFSKISDYNPSHGRASNKFLLSQSIPDIYLFLGLSPALYDGTTRIASTGALEAIKHFTCLVLFAAISLSHRSTRCGGAVSFLYCGRFHPRA
jgi:hypothetical protein